MRNRRFKIVFVACLLVLSGSLSAHHGSASFATTEITLKGKVTEWLWANPHCFLKIDAMDETGKVRNWNLEMGNPTDMQARGFARRTFKPGDEVFGGRNGALAEYITITEGGNLALKPAGVSFVQAAAVNVAGLTALQTLRDRSALEPGHFGFKFYARDIGFFLETSPEEDEVAAQLIACNFATLCNQLPGL